MQQWNIKWIGEKDYQEVVLTALERILKQAKATDLQSFNRNILDPVKLTYDYFASNCDKESIVNAELMRQQDKSVNNVIGSFHQNMLSKIAGCVAPKAGFDIEVPDKHIFAELKNKHNTMNSASSQKTYISMQQKLLEDDEAICYLVEVIAKCSQDIEWRISLNGQSHKHKKIRRISVDRFYELLTDEPQAFAQMIAWLPITIRRLIIVHTSTSNAKHIIRELEKSGSFFQGLYQQAFASYNGFQNFAFVEAEELGEDFRRKLH